MGKREETEEKIKIIDAHGHLGIDYVFDDCITEEEQLKTYNINGISGAIIQPLVCRPYLEDTAEIHDRIYRFAQLSAMKIWGLASINPHFRPEDYDRELERCIKKLRFVGVKITPIGHACNPSSKDGLHVFEMAKELRIPVMIHTGAGIPFSDPMCCAKAIEAFPDVSVVLAHSGTDMFYRQALYLAQKYENVFLEPSWLGVDSFYAVYKALGASRIMFSADGMRNVGVELEIYNTVIKNEEDREQAFWKTAADVFQLTI